VLGRACTADYGCLAETLGRSEPPSSDSPYCASDSSANHDRHDSLLPTLRTSPIWSILDVEWCGEPNVG
jgi:hypothetical protein